MKKVGLLWGLLLWGMLCLGASGDSRFTVSSDGVITDTKFGLQWIVGPDRDINYAQAEQWVAACKAGGGGWRMPAWEELKTLFENGVGKRNMDPSFVTTGWWVWGQPRDMITAWHYRYLDGSEDYYRRDKSEDFRVFGVRSAPKK
jgi:hypothetical protein